MSRNKVGTFKFCILPNESGKLDRRFDERSTCSMMIRSQTTRTTVDEGIKSVQIKKSTLRPLPQ